MSRKEILDAGASTADENERRALSYMAKNFDTIRGASTVFGSSTISKADMTYHHQQLHKTVAGEAVSEVVNGIDSRDPEGLYDIS